MWSGPHKISEHSYISFSIIIFSYLPLSTFYTHNYLYPYKSSFLIYLNLSFSTPIYPHPSSNTLYILIYPYIFLSNIFYPIYKLICPHISLSILIYPYLLLSIHIPQSFLFSPSQFLCTLIYLHLHLHILIWHYTSSSTPIYPYKPLFILFYLYICLSTLNYPYVSLSILNYLYLPLYTLI